MSQRVRIRAVQQDPKRQGAFTLVELLVVLGIIAVLIAILLPVINGARRQSRLVQCAANLRSIGQACVLHAQEHRGYLPLGGTVIADPAKGFVDFPAGLNDAARTRYTYAPIIGGPIRDNVVPFPAALAPYMGVHDLPFDDWMVLDQALNARDGIWRRFMCPDTDSLTKAKYNNDPNDSTVVDQGTMMVCAVGGVQVSAWATNSDYGLNEGVFGYHYDSRYDRNRAAGKLARVRHPSEVLLFADAVPRQSAAVSFFWLGWIVWTPALDANGPVTLGDAFALNPNAQAADNFDLNRHKGRINVAFADGHVETLYLTKENLDKVYLIPP